MIERTVEEVKNELTKLMAEHLQNLKMETFIPMSKEQMSQHEQRLKQIRKLSDEYLAFLRVDPD